MELYIKLKKKIKTDKNQVTIGDICHVAADSTLNIDDIKSITVFNRNNSDSLFVISIMDIIAVIQREIKKDITINNMGCADVVVEFGKKNDNVIIKWTKVIFISFVLLTGCATAIITFHVDSQLSRIFELYAQILGIEEASRIWVMEVPYSMGIALGIIVFFNHFVGKKITTDPTPIEVEMTTYEADVLETVIENLEKE